MMTKFLASLVLIIHFLYVLIVILPALLIPIGARLNWYWVRSRRLRILHVAMMGIVVIEALVGMICPLTWLENKLLESSGSKGYQDSFIGHWVSLIMYWEAPTWIFTVTYVLFMAWIFYLWRAFPPDN